MPRFPTYERQVGLSGGSTASFASEGAFTAPARALAGAGEAIADVGSQFAAVEQRVRETQDNTWFSKARAQTAVDMIGQEREAQTSATEGATDYTPRVRGAFDEYRKKKLGEAPSKRAAQMYEEWSDSYDVDLTQRSARFQAESELAKRTADFADTMNAHAQAILADPSQFDAVHKRAMDDFEGARQWMTPEQEVAAREKVDHDLKLARAKSMVEFQPGDFLQEVGAAEVTGDAAVNSVVDKIIGVESGGNANAKNPNSSASGLGQFTNGTWIATVRKHRPDLAGMSDAQLIRLKTDPKLGREMTARHTQDNAAELAAAGAPVTPGNLYLAHFAGIGGAKAVLQAGDSASVVDVLGSDVVNANGFLRGKTVGWLRNWAAKKMGGKGINVVGNPNYAGLSVDELLSLQGQAQTAVNTQQATAYAQMKDSFALGIQTGSVMSEAEILGSALNDGDKAALVSRFREVRKDDLAASDVIAGLADRSLSVNPYDTDARKNIDNAATAIKERATPDQYRAATEEIVRQTGVVPKDTVNGLRSGLESRNPQEVAAAAQQASRIASIDPAALARRDGGQAVQDAATSYDYYTNNVGLTPEHAAQRLMDQKDPEKVKARAALMETKQMKDFIKGQSTEANVRDIFDPGVFGFDPKLGETPAQSAAMVGEYAAILEESVFDAAGDTDLGEVLAAERFQQKYGVSEFTLSGPGVVTRLPPEKTYPTGVDGTHGYIREQAIEALAAEGVQTDEVFLVPDDMTEADVKTGQPARYQVFYRQGESLERFMLPFFAVPPAQSEVRQKRIEESVERMKQNRDDTLRGRDREGNLNQFLDGNPLTGGN